MCLIQILIFSGFAGNILNILTNRILEPVLIPLPEMADPREYMKLYIIIVSYKIAQQIKLNLATNL